MNEKELSANDCLTDYFLQDLNKTQALPLGDGAFDAALCAVSVQYLQYPERVFSEIGRALRPGGVVIVSFSNRMFAQKAIQAWRGATGQERLQLVARYLGTVGTFGETQMVKERPLVPPPQRVLGGAPDPFYAVWARRED
jgi:SAM-dependent methyltransferase